MTKTNRPMKDSGIEWIGEIPEDWDICRFKNVAKLYTGNSIKDEEKDNYTDTTEAKPYISTKDIDTISHSINYDNGLYIKNNDETFRIASSGSCLMCIEGGSAGKKKGLLNQDVAFVNKLCCFLPFGINGNYLFHFICSRNFEDEFFRQLSGLIGGVSVSNLKNMNITLPSELEQQKIAEFLDEKCSHIDSVLDKTKASIEEYKKLKQAVITQAVTKGIRPNRPMKDSKSVWFEQIPLDWEMKKIKYLFSIKKDIAGKEGYTVLSITQKGIKPKDLTKNEGQLAENYSNYQLVSIGDFAMNHMDLLTGWVDISKYEGVTSPDYRVFTLRHKENSSSRYYLYLLQMCYSNKIFYGLGQGVSGLGRWRLQADKFLNFFISEPSYTEQEEIADYLDIKCAEIDKLIEKKEQLISELETYKKSLIYEYVTGKKEVY